MYYKRMLSSVIYLISFGLSQFSDTALVSFDSLQQQLGYIS
jgi:hypothetical protein